MRISIKDPNCTQVYLWSLPEEWKSLRSLVHISMTACAESWFVCRTEGNLETLQSCLEVGPRCIKIRELPCWEEIPLQIATMSLQWVSCNNFMVTQMLKCNEDRHMAGERGHFCCCSFSRCVEALRMETQAGYERLKDVLNQPLIYSVVFLTVGPVNWNILFF